MNDILESSIEPGNNKALRKYLSASKINSHESRDEATLGACVESFFEASNSKIMDKCLLSNEIIFLHSCESSEKAGLNSAEESFLEPRNEKLVFMDILTSA